MAWLALTPAEIMILTAICFAAGVVRGFSGFALSALVMASAALILPPIQLIPICWWLELSASVLMARGGWQEADRRIVWGLVITSALGTPIGLWLTTSIDVESSKLIALCVIITLAALQLAKIRIPALASRSGLYGAGLLAGIVTGLASVGGMVIALYVLSSDTPARKMRAALVLFLFLSSVTSLIWLFWFEMMNQQAITRGVVFAVPAIAGVYAGMKLFTPRFEPYYRPFCLTLLCGLSAFGLLRLTLS
ncbi:sulfite exporter TauE/SafE family protein [Planktotalea sp.]|uniref:sulfite exporter TauE/SafE family protein n=1 Tax=Planktotalea sp. TaxID=2029877 RepID=UPI003D6B9747